jgi:restriction system protein
MDMAETENKGPSDRTLIVAGPGTGKTRILEQRTLNLLLRDDIDASHIAYFNPSESGVKNFKRALSRTLNSWLELNDNELAKAIELISGKNATPESIARARKRAEAVLKFDDSGLYIARTGALDSLPRRFDHLLIEDGAKLSDRQWEAITGPTVTGGGDKRRTIFAVGDEKQSIFSFGEPRDSLNRLNFNRLISQRQFRSSAAVLDAVDAVFAHQALNTPVMVGGLVVPERKTTEGVLIKSASVAWVEVARQLKTDWSLAYRIPSEKWEELIAGAYSRAGFDEVILTPRSGDYGRDVIAIRNGIGCIKIIGSVKAYKPSHLVSYDDVRALAGVLLGEQDASKGIISTTSDFPPRILSDPILAPLMPTRLELMNGAQLQKWLADLLKQSD